VGHLFKECPLNKKASEREKGKVTPQKISYAQGSPPVAKEAAILAHSDAEKEPTKEIRKKRGKAPFSPPSPPLTRERAAIEAALSMGMLNSTPSSTYYIASSHYIDTNTVWPHIHTYNPPISLECPFKPSSPIISCTPPLFPKDPQPIPHIHDHTPHQALHPIDTPSALGFGHWLLIP